MSDPAINVVTEMLAALEWYADQLCEGWCERAPEWAGFSDCGGCLARRIAAKARGLPYAKATGQTPTVSAAVSAAAPPHTIPSDRPMPMTSTECCGRKGDNL